jgi:hypothetical protein
MRNLFLLSAFCLSAVSFGAVTACGGDDDDKNTQNQEGSGGGGNDDAGPGAGGSKGTPTDDPAECEAAGTVYDAVDEVCLEPADAIPICKDRAEVQAPGTKVDDVTCGAGCTCTNCAQQMLDCGSDPEDYCPVILKCAQEKNCTGVGCYQPTTCQAEIDAAPGGGLSSISVALATEISTCAEAASCSAACL